jgi:hypothetical protein
MRHSGRAGPLSPGEVVEDRVRDFHILKIPHPPFGHLLPVGEGPLDYVSLTYNYEL